MKSNRRAAFRGKVAIVTGGASGIGQALARALSEAGASVVLADIDGEGAARTAEQIRAGGGEARAATVDVADAEAVAALVRTTVEQRGQLDYLFNNAGVAIVAQAQDFDLADWKVSLDTNLWGVIHGVQAAYPLMIEQGFGHIVNTASLAGLIPAVSEIAYVASKHAVVGLSTSLRAEARDYGVRVSVVCPGLVDTPILFENLRFKRADRYGHRSREDVVKGFGLTPMQVDAAARAILRGVAKNQAFILFPGHARVLWLLQRAAPSLLIRMGAARIRELRRQHARRAKTPG